MGYKINMKKYVFLMLISYTLSADEEIMKKYMDITKNISQSRQTLSPSELKDIKDPFVSQRNIDQEQIDTNETAQDPYVLYAIVQNKVKINQSWYGIKDTIDIYTISSIQKDSVILQNQTQTIKLNLKKGSSNVLINYK
ncbi:hypothetical protein CFF98v445_05600 [Campylobacter fetus subsp. fetus]|nr:MULTISPECIES: hypothetical protein [Campylobacter]EAK0796177.1 hypothetical protein [Campylobacter fetus]EGU24089.1 hypothetical protein CFV354_1082 [Campylobacter fetus subsp. venerealis NCTC 10354]KAA8733985.1 hypothetical protein F4U97_00170 [Campylobacter fetus subsp. fetus]OCS16755.1 hypothetical protein CfvWBT01109_01575 [Campylobacter fetus subsp. venerealis]OCS19909.1 hypothetical protein CFVI03596_07780 [Campylobacter fetus subsp. venerealis cfvi03/596]OCS23216.1 hypothetical prot